MFAQQPKTTGESIVDLQYGYTHTHSGTKRIKDCAKIKTATTMHKIKANENLFYTPTHTHTYCTHTHY